MTIDTKIVQQKAVTEIIMTVVACLIFAASPVVLAQAPRSPTPAPVNGKVQVETVAKGLEHPWALAFLPDGRILVTERPGRLRIVERDGRVSNPLDGVPRFLLVDREGFSMSGWTRALAENRRIYLSYAEPGEGSMAGTAVARGMPAASH